MLRELIWGMFPRASNNAPCCSRRPKEINIVHYYVNVRMMITSVFIISISINLPCSIRAEHYGRRYNSNPRSYDGMFMFS